MDHDYMFPNSRAFRVDAVLHDDLNADELTDIERLELAVRSNDMSAVPDEIRDAITAVIRSDRDSAITNDRRRRGRLIPGEYDLMLSEYAARLNDLIQEANSMGIRIVWADICPSIHGARAYRGNTKYIQLMP